VSTLSAEADKVAALRLALPATSAGIYLNAGSCGPLPVETAAAMAELADWELRLGRASPDTYYDVLQRMEEARASIAAIIAADTRDIALTHAVSEALNVAVWGIDWRPGDRAVTARQFEHAGGLSALYTVRDRLGIELDLVDVGYGADRDPARHPPGEPVARLACDGRGPADRRDCRARPRQGCAPGGRWCAGRGRDSC
jgi:selenocysteine lyase/cysteine desulfurase